MYVLDRRLPMDERQFFDEKFDEKLEIIEFSGKEGTRTMREDRKIIIKYPWRERAF